MKKIILLIFLLILPISLTGCIEKNFQPSQETKNGLVDSLNTYLFNLQKYYYCLADGKNYDYDIDYDSKDANKQLKRCIGPYEMGLDKAREKAKEVRNEMIERGLTVIDSNYANFVNQLYVSRSSGNFIADTIEITTSGVIGSLQGPAQTLRVLGIGLTAFQGGRTAFDQDFFNKETTSILINQMDTNRSKEYELILTNKNKDISDYPISEAIKDIVNYYNAGTLVRALSALSQQTAVNAQFEKNEIRHTYKGVPLSSPIIIDKQTLDLSASSTIIINKMQSVANDSSSDQQTLTKVWTASTYILAKIILLIKNDNGFQAMLNKTNIIAPTPRFNMNDTKVQKDDILQIVTYLRDIRSLESDNVLLTNKINKIIVDNDPANINL
jgi:hypothetical protein